MKLIDFLKNLLHLFFLLRQKRNKKPPKPVLLLTYAVKCKNSCSLQLSLDQELFCDSPEVTHLRAGLPLGLSSCQAFCHLCLCSASPYNTNAFINFLKVQVFHYISDLPVTSKGLSKLILLIFLNFRKKKVNFLRQEVKQTM